MPDNPEFDPAWLNSLVKRFVQLRQELEETAKQRDEFLIKYRKPNDGNEEDDDFYAMAKDTIIRNAAIKQISALLYFLRNDEDLVPELRKLSLALADLGNGRTVKWLHPAPRKKGQPPLSTKDGFLHGFYAAVMDWLMEEGGKSMEEAAKFVVEHGDIRRLIAASGRARRAIHPWETVANWRDRVTRPDATLDERSAFDEAYSLIRSQDSEKGANASIEDFAKIMLRFVNYRYSLF